ncbi:MAG: spherulation-specific family 4 protein [Actinobacteria bacterium]|nr:spherulation-specific family 4 protein [Actinomycetota bacterium]
MPTSPSVDVPTQATPRLIVPAYFHPSVLEHEWEVLAEHAADIRLIVLNLASGPGREPDAAFMPVLDRLDSTGVAVAGYVDTNYARRPSADVLTDLERYIDWYHVSGVFFDRVTADTENVAHYAAITQSARQAGVRVVAFNQGAHPVEAYAEHADLLGTFEGPWRDYVDVAIPRWTRSWPAERFFHLVYSVPLESFGDAYLLAARRHAGCVYVTDNGGDNPWDRLPGGQFDLQRR